MPQKDGPEWAVSHATAIIAGGGGVSRICRGSITYWEQVANGVGVAYDGGARTNDSVRRPVVGLASDYIPRCQAAASARCWMLRSVFRSIMEPPGPIKTRIISALSKLGL
jgi:hypothetical protein